jgi:hypothetical protein
MATRNRAGKSPELGHDAFLDVVANLVGVLIILVVVLGSSSKEVAEAIRQTREQAEPDTSLSIPTPEQLQEQALALDQETARAVAALSESQKLEQDIRASDAELAAAKARRDQLIDLLEMAKRAWQEEQLGLDTAAVERGRVEAKLVSAKSELETLQATRAQAEKTDKPVVAVSHLPTPMAKTVFGEELHFRLKGGRLAVVPIDRLVTEIRNEFERSVASSRDGRSDSAVGPIQGFIARYEMEKSRETISQNGRVGSATRIQMVSMVVEPISEPHGQPLAQVIANQASLLDIELAGRSPDRTTITVWVYPDSFAEFRQLKEHLYRRGFATAARPLPMDRPISGGPQGSKSTAQ